MKRLDLSDVFEREIKSVSLYGYGKSARSLIPHLLRSGYAVTVRDDRQDIGEDLPRGARYLLGKRARTDLTDDAIITSPSVRRTDDFITAVSPHTILTSDTDIFFRLFSGKSFCISGSSGKSTSATLLHEILSSSGDSHLIGNIGVPMTDAFLSDNIDRAVCEISSFNLQYDAIRPYRAAITNVKRNHLNWHKDFQEYIEAKRSLLSSALWFSVNLDDNVTQDLASLSSCYACYSLKFDYNSLHNSYKNKIIFTSTPCGIMRNDKVIISKDLIASFTEYNLYNLLTALSLSDGEADVEALSDVILSHKTLSHRCEEFLVTCGVRFIDSSIDTSPDRTYETLSALTGDIILLLGGRSKGESYAPLVPLIKEKCKFVFAFGEAADKIASELKHTDIPILVRKTMREAVRSALPLTVSGDTLLLSPASTSYDEFSSFEMRGDIFKETVKDAVRQENTGDKNEKVN